MHPQTFRTFCTPMLEVEVLQEPSRRFARNFHAGGAASRSSGTILKKLHTFLVRLAKWWCLMTLDCFRAFRLPTSNVWRPSWVDFSWRHAQKQATHLYIPRSLFSHDLPSQTATYGLKSITTGRTCAKCLQLLLPEFDSSPVFGIKDTDRGTPAGAQSHQLSRGRLCHHQWHCCSGTAAIPCLLRYP